MTIIKFLIPFILFFEMPLQHGYCVLIGKVDKHFIDPPDNEGRWPHYHIIVKTSDGDTFDSAINLKSRSEIKVEYRDFRNADNSKFLNILTKSDGLHLLASNPQSGALDIIRHPGVRDPICKEDTTTNLLDDQQPSIHYCNCTQWLLENGINTVKLMQYYLDGVDRVFIFGEPFVNGKGVHNVHMTQGDPIDSEFAVENGIWQDGGIIFEYVTPTPRISILITKFQTQSLNTDDNGKPI